MKAHVTESLLTESLEHLKKTGDVAATLRRTPEKAETLKPLLETAQQLSAHYTDVPRPPADLREGRAQVLAFAAIQRATRPVVSGKRTAPTKRRVNPLWRLAGVLAALMLVLIPLRGPLVSAARTTLPGNPLYILKLSSEDQLFSSMNEAEVKVVLAVSLTQERIEEMRALVEKQQEIPVDVFYRADYMLRTALMSAAWAPEPMMSNMLSYIIHHTREQSQQLELLKMQAMPQNLGAIGNMQTLLLKTQIIAMVALENPETFREAYQAGTPEKMPLPSGGPLSGVVITEELKQLITATPDSLSLPEQTVPTVPLLTPTASPTPSP
ncbi:MAG: hypothetical protein JXR84_15445 [Anaerolineae bacterium]|nr:hypothetical protein [Anaerolineae bacterium]